MERRQQSIFGTPPEPLFNLKPYYNSSEQLQDWMDALIQENEHRLQQPILTHIQVIISVYSSLLCLCRYEVL